MIRRFLILAALALAPLLAFAQNLTPAQKQTLLTNIQATPAALTLFTDGNLQGLADYYNATASPVFVIWRRDVSAEEIGNAWQGTDVDGMSALNMQRLQLMFASRPSARFDMSRADLRAAFENPFGTNANNASRVAMRAAWKRNATRAEQLFATGTGSDATPAVPTFTGALVYTDFQGL